MLLTASVRHTLEEDNSVPADLANPVKPAPPIIDLWYEACQRAARERLCHLRLYLVAIGNKPKIERSEIKDTAHSEKPHDLT